MVLHWCFLRLGPEISAQRILWWHSIVYWPIVRLWTTGNNIKGETWRQGRARSNYRPPPTGPRCLSQSYCLINEQYDTCLLWGCASTAVRRQQISRKDIYRASSISPTDKKLSLRDLIIAMCHGLEQAKAIKGSHCSGNEEDKLEQLGKNNTYQRRNILIYYCVFMIPIPTISIPRMY